MWRKFEEGVGFLPSCLLHKYFSYAPTNKYLQTFTNSIAVLVGCRYGFAVQIAVRGLCNHKLHSWLCSLVLRITFLIWCAILAYRKGREGGKGWVRGDAVYRSLQKQILAWWWQYVGFMLNKRWPLSGMRTKSPCTKARRTEAPWTKAPRDKSLKDPG